MKRYNVHLEWTADPFKPAGTSSEVTSLADEILTVEASDPHEAAQLAETREAEDLAETVEELHEGMHISLVVREVEQVNDT